LDLSPVSEPPLLSLSSSFVFFVLALALLFTVSMIWQIDSLPKKYKL
jgi:hypothetical protein